MSRVEFCIATSEGHAEQIVGGLRAAGLPGDAISVLFPDKRRGSRDAEFEMRRSVPSAGKSDALGNGLGRLAGTSVVVVPGLGLFVAAGPLIGVTGGSEESRVGGLSRALSSMGIPETMAVRYERCVRAGNFLIAVTTMGGRESTDVRTIFERAGAEDVVEVGPDAGSSLGHPSYTRW